MPREVTAVVLNYRTPEKTLACLQSLMDEEVERVVLVENSEDGGVALKAMQPGLDTLQKAGMLINLVNDGRNLGFAAGVNRALACAQSFSADPVLLINSDARLAAGALSHLLDAIDSGADMAAPLIATSGRKPQPPLFYYHKYLALLTQRSLYGSFGYITGACMLLAHEIAQSDLFDEDFFFYGEDVMLGAVMARRGQTCTVVFDAVVIHEGSGSAHNGSPFYEYHINRGHWLLARKLTQGNINYMLALSGRIIVLPLRAIARCVRFGRLTSLREWGRATMTFLRDVSTTSIKDGLINPRS